MALLEDHRPAGITESHLVEELASIVWRKRRVLIVEGAQINRGLRHVVHGKLDSPMPAAAPFESGLKAKGVDLPELPNAIPEEIAARHREAELDLAATRKAAAILRKGGPTAWERAHRALLADSRDWWEDHVEEEEYPATAEGLAQFIRETRERVDVRIEKEVRYQPAIRTQALGKGLQVHWLEKLSRYETHLDRKFERTLAMLLKLKQLRDG